MSDATFLGAQKIPYDDYNFCFIGVSFCSAGYLEGVERAANVIRKLSSRYANADGTSMPLKVYSPEEGFILKDARIVDYGTVYASTITGLEYSLREIKIRPEWTPIFVGSDHSASYEFIRKISSIQDEDFVVLQFDAHSDYIDEYDEYPHGSVMRQVSYISKVSQIVHFGLRGNLNSGPAIKDSIDDGNLVIPYVKIEESMDKVLDAVKGKKVYITFDTDFLNPIVAPATNCPEPGGPTYEDTLKYLKKVINASKEVIGMDFVEYNPKCNGSLVTGITIVNLIMESIHFILDKKLHAN